MFTELELDTHHYSAAILDLEKTGSVQYVDPTQFSYDSAKNLKTQALCQSVHHSDLLTSHAISQELLHHRAVVSSHITAVSASSTTC